MSSMLALGAAGLVVAGGLAFWFFNKSESDEKLEEQANVQFEDNTQAEVIFYFTIFRTEREKTEKIKRRSKKSMRRK